MVTEQLGLPFGTMLPFTQTYGGENSYQHPTLSNPSKKRFTSYDRSDVTGLHYAVNRSYSSEQGRFTQVDPIGMGAASLSNPQTLNMYAYCGNDPINHVDPSGLLFGWLKSLFRAVLKIAAVIVTVAAVLATVWTGNPFIAIAAWKLWLGAGALWAAAYGAGKLSRILGGVAGFGSVNAGSVLTPKTFPDQPGVGVGGVSAYVAKKKRKAKPKYNPTRVANLVISNLGFVATGPNIMLNDHVNKTIESNNQSGLDDRIIKCQAAQESNYDNSLIGGAGEIGLLQVMPSTATDLGFDPNTLTDIATNVRAGTQYLGKLAARFGGEYNALVAYNAGPNKFRKGKAGPGSHEYADAILGCARRLGYGDPIDSLNRTIFRFP